MRSRRKVNRSLDSPPRTSDLWLRTLWAQAAEAEDRMELDRVRGHSGLPMRKVEEGASGDALTPAVAGRPSRWRDPSPAQRRRSRCAGDLWGLRDHVVLSWFGDDVVGAVVLGADQDDARDDGEDVVLEREPPGRQ